MPSAARVYRHRRTAAREICVFWLNWGARQAEHDPNFMLSLARGLEVLNAFTPQRQRLTISQFSVLGILSLIASFSVAA
jgi:hypothetical protein